MVRLAVGMSLMMGLRGWVRCSHFARYSTTIAWRSWAAAIGISRCMLMVSVGCGCAMVV